MLRREWVKADLISRGCQPKSIWWVPLALWAPGFSRVGGPAFRVTYFDSAGLPHRACCWTSNFGGRQVIWTKDQPGEQGVGTCEREPIRSGRKRAPVITRLLVNAIPLGLAVYGLKCVIMRDGRCLVRGTHGRHSFAFVSVQGDHAIMTGFGYLAFGVFVFLSANEPSDTTSLFRRFARSVLRWVSFAMMIFFLVKAAGT